MFLQPPADVGMHFRLSSQFQPLDALMVSELLDRVCHVFSYAGSLALWTAMSVCQSTTLVQTEITQQIPCQSKLAWNLVEPFMFPREKLCRRSGFFLIGSKRLFVQYFGL